MAPESDGETPGGENPLYGMCFALLRSWKLVVFGTMVGIGCGLLAGLIKPNTYSSYGKLLLRLGAREEVSPESVVGGPAAGGRMMLGPREAVSNQSHILLSRAVFEKAVRQLGTDKVLAPYDPTQWAGEDTPFYKRWMFSFQKWWFARESAAASNGRGTTPEAILQVATEVLMRSVAVESAPGSTVFLVGYTSQTPYGAQTVLEGYMRAAEEYHREVFSSDDVIKLIQNQIQAAERDLSDSTSRMSAFKIEQRVFDLDIERGSLQAQLNELDETVEVKAIELVGINAVIKLTSEQLQNTPKMIEQLVMSTPQQNPEKIRLRNRIDDLGEELRGLEGRRLDREALERERSRINESLRIFQDRMRGESDLLESHPVRQEVPNPRHLGFQTAYDTLSAQSVQMAKEIEAGRARMAEIRARLIELEKAEPEYRKIEARLEITQREIKRLHDDLERMTNLRTLDEMKMGNLKILEPASMPLSKSGPSRGKYVVFGMFLGAMFSVAFALLRHFLDGRMRRPADLSQGLKIPVLAVVKDAPGLVRIAPDPARASPGGKA